jgi:hypothetical protein
MISVYETGYLREQVASFIRRFVHMTDEQLLAVSLWALFTWVVDSFDVAPYLDVSSPTRECGKTRLFECLELVCKAPRRCTGHTEATLFRMVAAEHPTMLMDEIDTTFGKDPKLYAGIRGVLDEGHRRGGSVPRMVGEGKRMEIRYFDVFGPKAFAGIGNLPETVATRSIPIRLEKMPRSERVERFRRRYVDAGVADLLTQLAEWSDSVTPSLQDAQPSLPDLLSDRQWDIWEPLFAISDLADVGADARSAAVHLHAGALWQASAGLLALEHLREVFDGHDRMPTKDVLGELVIRDDGPWAVWWGNDVDAGHLKGPASRLAKLLREFGVQPKQFKLEGQKERGYERGDFEKVWDRYLSPLTPVANGTTVPGTSEMASDLQSTEVPSVAGEVASTVLRVVPNPDGPCPSCGSRSSAKGYSGHAEGCPEFYGRASG